MPDPNEIVLIRHGATEWSVTKQHTGRSDIPLTDHGREQAQGLRDRLREWEFALVLTSPLQRARETASLCGFDDAQVDDALREWDYGEYEGLTTADIRTRVPDWTVFSAPCPGGETPEEVGARADEVLARVRDARGPVALFSHGHFLRVFTTRWLGLPAVDGRLFSLDTARICVLGHERDVAVIQRWNV
jgi:broad specificity phosphatase PhoE